MNTSMLNHELTLAFSNDIGSLPEESPYGYKIVISVIAVGMITVALLANVTLLSIILAPARRNAIFKFNRSNDISITIFVAVLAFDDILMVLVNGSLLVLTAISDSEWAIGETVCRLKDPVTNAVVGVSCWLMMVIAWQRFQRLCNTTPINQSNIRKASILAAIHAGIVVAVIFGLHSLFSIPAILNSSLISTSFQIPIQDKHGVLVEFKEVRTGSFCVQNWKSPSLFVAYSVTGFLLSFLLPLAFTVGIHIKVISYLTKAAPKLVQSRKYLRKTTHILVAVLVTFFVCWSPFKMLALFVNVKSSGLFIESHVPALLAEPVIINSFKLLTLAQACLNPILYGWFVTRRRSAHDSVTKQLTRVNEDLSQTYIVPKDLKYNDTLIGNEQL